MSSFKGKIIDVKIAERSYPVEIMLGEEKIFEHALNAVQKDLASFKNTFGKQDIQDFLAMTLLTYAVNLEQQKNADIQQNHSELLQKLHDLETQLDSRLSWIFLFYVNGFEK